MGDTAVTPSNVAPLQLSFTSFAEAQSYVAGYTAGTRIVSQLTVSESTAQYQQGVTDALNAGGIKINAASNS